MDVVPIALARTPVPDNGFFVPDMRCLDLLQEWDASHRALTEALHHSGPRRGTALSQAVLRRGRRALTDPSLGSAENVALEGPCADPVSAAAERLVTVHTQLEEVWATLTTTRRAALAEQLETNDQLIWAIGTLGEAVQGSRHRFLTHHHEPDKRHRKHELVFTRILTRASMKTSPLSRFATVTISTGATTVPSPPTSRFTLHNTALFELYEAIALSDAAVDWSEWELRPYADVTQGMVVAFTEEWNGDGASVYRTRDGAVRIPAVPALREMVRLRGTWDVSRMRAVLGLDLERARVLLRRLVEVGLLRPTRLPSDREDLAWALAESVEEWALRAGPEGDELQQCAQDLRQITTSIAHANATVTTDALTDVSRRVVNLREKWGARGRRAPSSLVYEDYLEEGAVASLGTAEDIASIEGLLALWPLFDVNVRVQLTFRQRMRELGLDEVGATSADYFRVSSEANATYRSFWEAPWQVIPSDVETVRDLDALRKEFVALAQERAAASGIVRITVAEAQEIRRKIPAEVRGLTASYSVFTMDHPQGVVVNKLFPGYLAFFNRFLRHVNVHKSVVDSLDALYSEAGVQVAEIYETNGFNGATHGDPVFRRRLTSVYTRDHDASASYESSWGLEDCVADVRGIRPIIRTPTGERLQPVIASNLVRTFFPAYTAFTAALYTNINHLIDPAGMFLPALDPRSVIRTPRVLLGSAVIDRERWFLSTSLLPRSSQNESSHGRVARLASFLRRHGVPLAFYYHLRRASMDSTHVGSISHEFEKPQYFDVSNPLLVNTFLNAVRIERWIMLVEPLPTGPAASESVHEFVVRGDDD